ncbi:MAG: hypothetical protein ACXABY_03365 [Candidatus Thorarchaeota archaeon]|jgi:hypothetical protein
MGMFGNEKKGKTSNVFTLRTCSVIAETFRFYARKVVGKSINRVLVDAVLNQIFQDSDVRKRFIELSEEFPLNDDQSCRDCEDHSKHMGMLRSAEKKAENERLHPLLTEIAKTWLDENRREPERCLQCGCYPVFARVVRGHYTDESGQEHPLFQHLLTNDRTADEFEQDLNIAGSTLILLMLKTSTGEEFLWQAEEIAKKLK